MTHLHSHSDVFPASNLEQPKVSFPRGHQIVRRPVKALLGVVLIGSAVGIGVLIAGRSAAPGIDQTAQVSPATAPSSSVGTELYQPGTLAGQAPVEEWRVAESGAFGETYRPGALAGYAPPEVWSQAERGTDLPTPASAAMTQHAETLSAEEGRRIGLAAVEDIQRQAHQAAGCPTEESECPPTSPADRDSTGLGKTGDGVGQTPEGSVNP